MNYIAGINCETEIKVHTLCESDPCLNNGTCRVLPGANIPECVCAPGFKGTRCEIDINDCLSNPCENGGNCFDRPNNYTCYCQHTGYEGINCEININECFNNPCLNHGVCFDTYGSYICQCQEGYGGQNCEQVSYNFNFLFYIFFPLLLSFFAMILVYNNSLRNKTLI